MSAAQTVALTPRRKKPMIFRAKRALLLGAVLLTFGYMVYRLHVLAASLDASQQYISRFRAPMNASTQAIWAPSSLLSPTPSPSPPTRGDSHWGQLERFHSEWKVFVANLEKRVSDSDETWCRCMCLWFIHQT